MKKLFTKIVGISLGIAMAIGVGVGTSSIKEAKRLDATATGTYNLVTSTNGIAAGDTVIIVNHAAAKAIKSISTTSTKYGLLADVSATNNQISLSSAGVAEFVVRDGNSDGSFAFEGVSTNDANGGTAIINGKYLSWTSGNSLNIGASIANTTSWTLDNYSASGMTIKSVNDSARVMRFNSDRFACYTTSTGTLVDIYKKAAGGGGPTALANPNPQYNDSTKLVSWTTDANATKYQVKVDTGEYADINTETYNAGGLTIGEEHTVYIKAVGDGASYESTEGHVTFTPTAPFVGSEFILCTSTSDLEAGANYIIASGTEGTVKVMSTESSANNRRQTEVTVDDITNKITTTSSTLVLTLGGSSGAWTFLTTNYAGTDGYFESASSGTSNNLLVNAHANVEDIPDNGKFTITFSEGIPAIQANAGNKTIMRHNSGSNLFSLYSTGQNNVYLWREYSTKTLASLNVTGSPTKTSGYYDTDAFDPTGITAYQAVYDDDSTKELTAGDINWPALTAGMTSIQGSYTEGGVTVYTPSYTLSAVVADTFTISLSGSMVTSYYTTDSWDAGSLVATANYLSGKSSNVTASSAFTYYSDSAMNSPVATPNELGTGSGQTIYVKATYETVSNAVGYSQTVTVTIEHGTQESDPLTAAQAIEIGNALAVSTETTKQYYIQGVVSSVVENALGAGFNNATFYLEEDNGDLDFEVYRITADAGCTNYSDLQVGAEVLIVCRIQKYSASKIENGSVSSLLSISYASAALEGVTLNKTSITLGVGENDTLTASPSPLAAELGDVAWTSSDNDVATVAAGVVSAVAAGSATITATAGGFNTICNVTVLPCANLDLSTNTTASASTTQLTWNVANKFAMQVDKGSAGTATNNYYPGTEGKTYSSTRFYSGSIVTITPNPKTVAVKAIFTATSDSYATALNNSSFENATHSVSGSVVTVTFTDGTQPVTITIGGTCGFTSVKYFYTDATAKQEIENGLTTLSALRFNYSGASEITGAAIRFGGFISDDLWNALNSESTIQGYGVLIAETSWLQTHTTTIKKEYATALELCSGDVDDALELMCGEHNGDEAIRRYTANGASPATANSEQKAFMGVSAGDTYYTWQVRINFGSKFTTSYTAVAFIKTADGLVFFDEISVSAKELATAVLPSIDSELPVHEPIQYISERP